MRRSGASGRLCQPLHNAVPLPPAPADEVSPLLSSSFSILFLLLLVLFLPVDLSGTQLWQELVAIISVHAQFPKNVSPNTKPELAPTNWEWRQCLAFPVDKLNSLGFSSKPYKCIRFATGVVSHWSSRRTLCRT